MTWSGVAAILLGLAVAVGAFGAHGLKGRIDAYSMGIYERAVFYHFVHALGLLVVSILPKTGVITRPAGSWVCWLLLAGIILFCGSLYILAVTGVKNWGVVTPLGGLSFIAAWLVLAYALLRQGR
jgi:uncharacterized membrane protein YgdD (TMEM256/DUF423 family)